MKRVIIIEDENLVLMGIVSLFDHQDTYHVVGKYTNPLRALDELDSTKPDIILTDIKMPQLDGLSLIKRVRTRLPDIPILVLSCLDDFKTVSSAFKLGIHDYMLKHDIDGESLFTKLDSIPVKAGRESHPESSQVTTFSAYLKSDLTDQYPDGLYLYQIIFKKLYDADSLPIRSSVNLPWAYRATQEILNAEHAGEVFISQNRDLVCIMDGREETADKRKQVISEVLKHLSTFINNPVFILKSNRTDISDLQSTWSAIAMKRGCSFYREGNEIISVDSSRCSVSNDHIRLPDPLLLFSGETMPKWETQVAASRAVILRKKIDPTILSLELVLYWNSIEKIHSSLFGEDSIPIDSAAIFRSIQGFDHAESFLHWYIQTIRDLHSRIISYASSNHTIVKIKIYLHEHYAEHITLSRLSERFHLHEAYLSELFKKDAGIGYLEYLTSVRIDKAKALLRESNRTAEEIGMLTGFINASHFSKIFKKYTGRTITEFRGNPDQSEE